MEVCIMEHISKSFNESYSPDRMDESQFPDWTIEEFDAIQENHAFSPRYRRAMRQTVRKYRRASRRRLSFPAALSAAAACAVLPICVYAAVTHADFFQNVFGNASRQSVASHEVMVDNGKGGQTAVTLPERTYTAVDEETAESLIGSAVTTEPLSVNINDHTLTINSAVRDEDAIVMDFTVTCDSGVKLFDYDDLSNETKGPQLSEEATFYFHVADTAEMIYIDTKGSTDTSLHGYYYGLFVFNGPLDDGRAPILDISYADSPYLSLPEAASIKDKHLEIPAAKALRPTAFTSESGGSLKLSPISLTVNMGKGLGFSAEEASEPGNLKTLTIEYLDGTVYEVLNTNDHVDNTAYLCGSDSKDGPKTAMVFNRLIDPSSIKSVTVNDTVYFPDQSN